MVSRKPWISETIALISLGILCDESQSLIFSVCSFLLRALKFFKSQSQIFKQGSWCLGKSQILPFITFSLAWVQTLPLYGWLLLVLCLFSITIFIIIDFYRMKSNPFKTQ